MNPKMLASFCVEGRSVYEPNPAALALWLRVHMDAIPHGQTATSVFVQIGNDQITKISEDKGAGHLTGEHITLSVPVEHFSEVLAHLTSIGCGMLTVGDSHMASVWVEKEPVGFIRIKKITPA